jgi:hypothetical protein
MASCKPVPPELDTDLFALAVQEMLRDSIKIIQPVKASPLPLIPDHLIDNVAEDAMADVNPSIPRLREAALRKIGVPIEIDASRRGCVGVRTVGPIQVGDGPCPTNPHTVLAIALARPGGPRAFGDRQTDSTKAVFADAWTVRVLATSFTGRDYVMGPRAITTVVDVTFRRVHGKWQRVETVLITTIE